jgi:hypothetical protein
MSYSLVGIDRKKIARVKWKLQKGIENWLKLYCVDLVGDFDSDGTF